MYIQIIRHFIWVIIFIFPFLLHIEILQEIFITLVSFSFISSLVFIFFRVFLCKNQHIVAEDARKTQWPRRRSDVRFKNITDHRWKNDEEAICSQFNRSNEDSTARAFARTCIYHVHFYTNTRCIIIIIITITAPIIGEQARTACIDTAAVHVFFFFFFNFIIYHQRTRASSRCAHTRDV